MSHETQYVCRQGREHTWLLLGRVGLAEPCSATESEAGDARAEEGLKSWRVAREGGRGWGASWGRGKWALGE